MEELAEELECSLTSRVVDFPEVCVAMIRKMRAAVDRETEEEFLKEAFPVGGDDVMTVIDLRLVLSRLAEDWLPALLSDDEVDELIRVADPTGSGWVDRNDVRVLSHSFV